MKILRLDLLAFGPFIDATLALEPGEHGLHIIQGPNEAGKSSALRALIQFLYKIPHNSKDNFVHAHPRMRIGATLRHSDGSVLESIRRKTLTKSLRGADDVEVVDPMELSRMLGDLDQSSFERRFGIDYEELVRGGRAIVDGRGDLGEMLFAAGSGVADLRPIQKRLEEQSEQLFKPAGKNLPSINKALADLRKATADVKDAQLSSTEWVKHEAALQAAEEQFHHIQSLLLEKGREKQRISRIAEAVPHIATLKRLREELEPLANVPLLPDDFHEKRINATTGIGMETNAMTQATETIDSIEKTIGETNIAEALLENSAAILQLHKDLAVFDKARKDRTPLEVERKQLEHDACEILRDLDWDGSLAEAEQNSPSRTDRSRIQRLSDEQDGVLSRITTAKERVDDLRVNINRIEQELDTLENPSDIENLRKAVRDAQQQGDLESRHAQEESELRELKRQAEIDLKKMGLFSGSLAELEVLAVPSIETIDRFENELADIQGQISSIQQRLEDDERKQLELKEQIEQVRLEKDVPTESDLESARVQREEGWRLIVSAWRDKEPDEEKIQSYISALAPKSDLTRAYESSVEQADQTADRLRREADLVAQKASDLASLQKLERQIEQAQAQLHEQQKRLEEKTQQWKEIWSPVNIEPLSPREMRAWSVRHAELVKSAGAIHRQEESVRDLETRVTLHRTEISQSLEIPNATTSTERDSLNCLLRSAEEWITHVDDIRNRRHTLDRDQSLRGDELSTAERQVKTGEDLFRGWQEQWVDAVKVLQLDVTASPEEARLVLAETDRALAKFLQAKSQLARIDTMDRDGDEFEKNARSLIQLVAADLENVSVSQAVAGLNDRLSAAQTAQARLDELRQQLDSEKERQTTARTSIRDYEITLESMCREAGCNSPDELSDAEQRSARRREIEKELHALDLRLTELAAGTSLDSFILEAEQFDRDELAPRMRQMEEELSELEREKSAISETIGSERLSLKLMDGSAKAAEASQVAQNLVARIRHDAEQYIRLRLAAVVLRRSIESYREKNQDPVLRRASELFAELTLGSFQGLQADDNDKGETVLVGVRPDGQGTVVIEGMSDGTCDQLYLALRLASLENYLAEKEPIPLLVDDILVQFDDDRAAAALKTLARLSEKTQVIFFTHHDHLVRLAEENLDDDLLFIHRLNCRTPSVPTTEAIH